MKYSLRFRIILLMMMGIVIQLPVIAQIPNNGFENWSINTNGFLDPDGWETSNYFGYLTEANIVQTTYKYTGSYAVLGRVGWILHGFTSSPWMSTRFHLNQRPLALTGHYKFVPVNQDTFLIDLILYKNGSVISYSHFSLPEYSDYQGFGYPISYSSNEIPDSGYIYIEMKIADWTSQNAYWLLDDLDFSYISGVPEKNESSNYTYILTQNYPNPFNSTTRINYTLQSNGFTTINIYDVLGKKIATLLNDYQTSGSHYVGFDATNLTSGVYLYIINSGEYTEVKKMLLMK